MKFQTIYQFFSYNRSRSQKGKRTSTSDDHAPDFANDVKLPSICPAVNVCSLVSLKCHMCLCGTVDQSYCDYQSILKLLLFSCYDTTTVLIIVIGNIQIM